MKREKILSTLCLSIFLLLFLISGASAQRDALGETGAGPVVSQDEAIGEAISTNELTASTAGEVLGDTGKPGLGGNSGSQPMYLPDEDPEQTINSNGATAQIEDDALGDTGKPGLGGDTGSQPMFITEEDVDDIASTDEKYFQVKLKEALTTLLESTGN